MKAHIKDNSWDKAEKLIKEQLQKQNMLGFAEGMKAEAGIVNEILSDHTKSTEVKLKEIQTHVNWCLTKQNEDNQTK